ncbi:uncharacterized protein ISCGN_010662 [Ixodes scapularis]
MFSGENLSAAGRGNVMTSDNVTEDYRIILPRLTSGNLSLNSVFLHGDLSARPYRAPDFRDALRGIVELKDVVSLGQFQMSHVWMLTCVNAVTKAKLVAQRELRVKGRKCLIIDPDKQEVNLKLLWLPQHLEDRRVIEALAPFGKVRSIKREKWRCSQLEHMETLNREVVLVLGDGVNASQIPHLLQVYGCQSLVLIPGRPPLCLRCNKVGHIRRYCRTPRCSNCRRYGHQTEECVNGATYADMLRQRQTHEDDTAAELLMDVSEVADVTGELPPVESAHPSGDARPGDSTDTQPSQNIDKNEEFPVLEPAASPNTSTTQNAHVEPDATPVPTVSKAPTTPQHAVSEDGPSSSSSQPLKRPAPVDTEAPSCSSGSSTLLNRVGDGDVAKKKASGSRAKPNAKPGAT